MSSVAHLDLDGAWPNELLGLPRFDVREWGPQLRFSAPPRLIENFYRERVAELPAFVVYGSGDFHHLSGLLVRRVNRDAVLVSFDNHPDWDVRPPKWCCGSWVNRALELPHVQQVSVWGCGNFECWWPGQLFGNRRAERNGNLEVHPWADDRSPKDKQRRGAILRDNWRQRFLHFVDRVAGTNLYVTIDMDCLVRDAAITSWENGRFDVADLEWALGELRSPCNIIGGDICGAFSPPRYARRKQRFASEMDHPKIAQPSLTEAQRINSGTLARLLPALTG